MKAETRRIIPRASALLLISLLLMTQVTGASPQAQGPQPEVAATPLISYQGTLTDENGDPINTAVTMKFALYNASSGGTMVWGTETQTVQVTDGQFNVLLGSLAAIDPAKLTGDLWLNIIVNNEQLTPRERVAGATYALAGMADPFTVPGKLVIGPGTLSEPLQVKASWSVLGLDTLAAGQDAGVRLYHNGVAQWFLLNDASEGNQLHLGANGSVAFTIAQYGDMNLYRSLNMNNNPITGVGSLTITDNNIYMGGSGDGYVALRKDAGQRAMHVLPWGGSSYVYDKVCIGCGSGDADLEVHGAVTCGALTEANLQTEEERKAGGSDRFEEGDLLCWSAKAQSLERCVTPSDPLVQAVADAAGRPIVIGAEVVKVIGPVRAGDYLVASSVPGYAVASPNPTFGIVIAQALEDFTGERGLIRAMIRKM